MNKRIFTLFLCIFILCQCVVTGAYSDVEKQSPYYDAITRLSEYGIISGYPDGSFCPDGKITRAEFAKLTVVLSGKEDTANTLKAELFTDVSKDNWASGYINQAAKDKLITGYPDGTFSPDEKITYNQALTICVRMLGFTGNGESTRWPDDFIQKAEEYGLLTDLEFSGNDEITRGVTALVLDRVLTKADTDVLSDRFAKKVTDTVIYGTNTVNKSISSDTVVTSKGTYSAGSFNADNYLGKKVTLWLDKDNEITGIMPDEQKAIAFTLSSAHTDEMVSTTQQSFKIDENTVVYYDAEKTTYNKVYDRLMSGCEVTIYDDYIYAHKTELFGPYTVTQGYSQVYSFFGDISPSVIRDGKTADITDISRYDVLYYNQSTNRLYAYCDSVTGIYESASPTKDNLTSVTVSSKEYKIGTAQAKNKLDDSPGAFETGTRVTLLFGNDNTVVDVVDKDSISLFDMGVVLSVSTKVNEKNETDDVVNIMLADGNTVTYVADANYKKLIGDFVYINYLGDAKVSLDKVKEHTLSGDFDRTVPSYAGFDFAERYMILELVSLDEETEAVVQKLQLRDITQKSLDKNKVIHVEYANTMNDIAVMYVKDITGSNYQYGLVYDADIKVTGEGANENVMTSFDIITTQGKISYRASSGYRFSKGTVIGIKTDNGQIKSMYALQEVERGRVIQDYTAQKVKINDNIYKISDDVLILKQDSDNNWITCSLEELKGKTQTEIRLYVDRRIDENGLVRVIKIFA